MPFIKGKIINNDIQNKNKSGQNPETGDSKSITHTNRHKKIQNFFPPFKIPRFIRIICDTIVVGITVITDGIVGGISCRIIISDGIDGGLNYNINGAIEDNNSYIIGCIITSITGVQDRYIS